MSAGHTLEGRASASTTRCPSRSSSTRSSATRAAADLGRSVLARLPAPTSRRRLSLDTTFYFVRRHDQPVPPSAASRPTGRGARTAWRSSSSTSSRSASSAGSRTRCRARSRPAYAVNAPMTSDQGGLQTGSATPTLVPDRLRPDAQPDRGRELRAAHGLAVRHALPGGDRLARHADVGGGLRRRLRQLRLPAGAGRTPRAGRRSTSSTCASTGPGPSTPGSSAPTSTSRTSTTQRTRRRRSRTTAAGRSMPIRGIPFLPILGIKGMF